MNDKTFNLAILGIVGLVLLIGVVLLVQKAPLAGAVAEQETVLAPQVLESEPVEGEKCLNPGSCRTLQLCSTVSDGLYTDGVGMGCVNAEDNSNVPYCRRLTKAQGSEPCNYMDKNPRCVCL